MRLRSDFLAQIISALNPFFMNKEARLFLFGSRTKDHLKGGDIDLALIIEDKGVYQTLKSNKHKLMSALHQALGERKIDLRLVLEGTEHADPFLKAILPEAIELHRWKKNHDSDDCTD